MKINRRYLHNIKSNRSFYVSASILTMVTLLLFYLFYIAGTGIADYGDSFFKEHAREDATFYTYDEIKKDDIDKIEKRFDLTLEKEHLINLEGRASWEDCSVRVFSPNEKIDTYEVIEGGNIKKKSDILVSAGYARSSGLRIGERIELCGRWYDVKGFFLRPDYLYMLENQSDDYKNETDFFAVYMKKTEFRDLFGNGAVNYKVRYSKETDIVKFRKYIDKHYSMADYMAADENLRISFVHEQADMFILSSWIILLVFPFITVALISIITGRKVTGEQKLIGTLSALGYTRGQLMRHYSLMAVIPGIFGGLLTSVASLALAEPFGSIGLADYEPMPVSFTLPLWVAAAGVIIPTVIYWCAAIIRVSRLLKNDTVLMLSGTALKKGKIRRVFARGRMKVSRRFAMRTLLASPGRTFVVFLGIFLGTFIVAFAFLFLDSVKEVGDQAHGEFGSFKYQYVLNELKTDSPGEGEAMTMLSYESDDGRNFSLNGADPGSRLWNLETTTGERADIKNGWYMSSLAMKLFDKKTGDTFVFRDPATLEKHKVKISGEIKNGYQAYLLSARTKVNQLADLQRSACNVILAKEKLGIDKARASETITDKTFKNQMENMLGEMKGLILALMVIGIIICISASYVSVSTMTGEYKYTVSMLKVLGFTGRKINNMIIEMNHLLLLPGITCGLAGAYYLMVWYSAEFVEIEHMIVPVKMAFSSAAMTILIVTVSYFAAVLLAKHKLEKTDMIQELKDNRE